MTIHINHGNGGRETARLIADIFEPAFRNPAGTASEDAAMLPLTGPTAFTTDSFVVKPLFFPGGDIGRLAVCGTVNDLLTTGSTPRYLSAAFVLEEGLAEEDLRRAVRSMAEAAREAGVNIVTGDTKVIDGAGGLIINTAGLGELRGEAISFRNARAGDQLLVTGTLGDHHACLMSARMGISNGIASDAAPLTALVAALRREGIPLHGLRDLTRGGLATCLHEISRFIGLRAALEEERLPVNPEVSGLCQILGLDPLYMANEGKMVMAVPAAEAERALAIARQAPYGENAALVGRLEDVSHGGGAVLHTKIGGKRVLPPLVGDTLPRIC